MTGIIILAAGASTRLGRAKQNLKYKDRSLLQHTIDTAVKINAGPVIVVLGANETEIAAQVEDGAVSLVVNTIWKEGMASSIQAGLAELLNHKESINEVLLMVCDQPFVDEDLLLRLLEEKKLTGKAIIACSYKDAIGVPALFDKTLFRKLLCLKGEEGGKKILMDNLSLVASIPFPKGSIDIDTEKDYEALIG